MPCIIMARLDDEFDGYGPGLKGETCLSRLAAQAGSREGADYDWCQGACEMS